MGKTIIFKRLGSLIGASSLLISILLFSTPVLAASANVYLSPSSSSVAKGSYITVSVRENSGAEPVNAAQISLSYPTSLLSFVSISSTSAFSIVAQSSGGGGSVQIGRGALPAVSGTQTIATVRFKALASSGRATVSIKAGSSVISANSNSNIATGLSGGSYSLVVPAPTPQAPPPDTTPPKVTSVKVSDVTFSSAVISWTTSEPATSQVEYGTSKSYGLVATDNNLVTAHKLKLNSPLIVPAQQYNYRVKSTDAAGNAATSPDSTFKTQGVNLAITVIDQDNKPVSGAKVSVLDASATTDQNGHATIATSEGKQTLVIDYKGHTYAQAINVKPPDAKNTPQAFKSSITTKSGLLWPLVLIVILVAIIAWLIGKGGHGIKGLYYEAVGLWPGKKSATPNNMAATPAPAIIKPTKDA